MILPVLVWGTSARTGPCAGIVGRQCFTAEGDDLSLGADRVGFEDDVGLDFPLDVVRLLAHGGEGDGGMGGQDPLDLGRVDVVAAGQDHVLLAVDDEDAAVFVHRAEVARVQPAVGLKRFAGFFFVAVISDHHDRSPHHWLVDLAARHGLGGVLGVGDAQFAVGQRTADRAVHVGAVERVGRTKAGDFVTPQSSISGTSKRLRPLPWSRPAWFGRRRSIASGSRGWRRRWRVVERKMSMAGTPSKIVAWWAATSARRRRGRGAVEH